MKTEVQPINTIDLIRPGRNRDIDLDNFWPFPMIKVYNWKHSQTVNFPVVFIRGGANLADGTLVLVENRSSNKASNTYVTSVRNNKFKALVELVPGKNTVVLRAGGLSSVIKFEYIRSTGRHKLRFVYFMDSSGDTRYQTPVPHDTFDYHAKLDTAVKLMQAFISEQMKSLGYGSRTFNAEFDSNDRLIVHSCLGSQSLSEYLALPNDGAVAGTVGDEIRQAYPLDGFVENVAIIAFTRWDPVAKRALGHCAGAGNGVASFGSGGLFSWPSTLQQVDYAFSDITLLDPSKYFDDSVGRRAFWAVASTTMGALMHEIGHLLGAVHTSNDPFDIMARGFDHLNRFFSLIEPPCFGNMAYRNFTCTEEARINKLSGAMIAFCRKMNPTDVNAPALPSPVFTKPSSTTVRIEAEHGLRTVAIGVGDVRSIDVFDPPLRIPKNYLLRDLALRSSSTTPNLYVKDGEGNPLYVPPHILADPTVFVTNWSISPAIPRSFNQGFPTDPNLDLFADSTSQSFQDAYIDLVKFHRAGGTDNFDHHVTYALTRIQSNSSVNVKALAACDDTLRVWCNGILVFSTPSSERPLSPDEYNFQLPLSIGSNSIVVEVMNAGGDWGFLFRIQDYMLSPTSGSLMPVFLHRLRFSTESLSCPFGEGFLNIDPNTKTIELLAQPVVKLSEAYIDLAARYPGVIDNRVVYALCQIIAPQATTVTLLAGSDDAIRVWNNGQLVHANQSERPLRRDQDQATFTLKAGINLLLIEVSNYAGGWGFYCRLLGYTTDDLDRLVELG